MAFLKAEFPRRYVIERHKIGKLLFPFAARQDRRVQASYWILVFSVGLIIYALFATTVLGATKSRLASVAALLSCVVAWLLFRYGKDQAARLVLILSANIYLFGLNLLAHPAVNLNLVFFGFIGLPFIAFSIDRQRSLVLALAALPFVFWNILMITDSFGQAFVEVDRDKGEPFGYSNAALIFLFIAVEFLYYDYLTNRFSRAMEAALRAEKRTNRAKTAFLASINHELRTPLNAVIGGADLLRGHPKVDEELEQIAQYISSSGQDILALTEKTLAFSRLASGKLTAKLSTFNPYEVVQQELLKAHQRIAVKHQRLETHLDKDLWVRADRMLLSDAFAQIMDNAIRYTPENGQITVRLEQIDGLSVRLSIQDTGPGVPKDAQGLIFRAFERLDQSLGTLSGGGVGLAIVKAYANAMEGKVGIHSEAGNGAHIWIEVPAALKLDKLA